MATDQMYRDIFYYICGKDNSSEYFEGIWIDRTTCTWDNATVSLLRPVSCQREIGTEFMCRVIDVELVSGTLPTDVSFSETRKSTIGDTECFYVNGSTIKKGPDEEDAVFFNSDDRSIEFDEYKDPMGKFGICRKRWEKQGIVGIINSTVL